MDEQLKRIASRAQACGIHITVAESLTCGAVASRLGAGPQAAEWFRGGIVAYDESVKYDLLGVTPGPVVTKRCARELAIGASRLLSSEYALGVTGVGGPGPSEGRPPGTVIIAVARHDQTTCQAFRLPVEPEEVIEAAVDRAITMLEEALSEAVSSTHHRPGDRPDPPISFIGPRARPELWIG